MMRQFAENIRWGTLRGAAVGGAFSLLAAALALMKGTLQFEDLGVSLYQVVIGYMLAGTASGMLVGLVRPFLNWRAITWAVSAMCGVLVLGAVYFVAQGPPSAWGPEDFGAVLAIGLIAGGVVGNSLYTQKHGEDIWHANEADARSDPSS